MEAYQQRVIDERDALRKKRIDLGNFLRADQFKAIEPHRQRELLEEQFKIMIAYEAILDERISFYPVYPAAKI